MGNTRVKKNIYKIIFNSIKDTPYRNLKFHFTGKENKLDNILLNSTPVDGCIIENKEDSKLILQKVFLDFTREKSRFTWENRVSPETVHHDNGSMNSIYIQACRLPDLKKLLILVKILLLYTDDSYSSTQGGNGELLLKYSDNGESLNLRYLSFQEKKIFVQNEKKYIKSMIGKDLEDTYDLLLKIKKHHHILKKYTICKMTDRRTVLFENDNNDTIKIVLEDIKNTKDCYGILKKLVLDKSDKAWHYPFFIYLDLEKIDESYCVSHDISVSSFVKEDVSEEIILKY